MHKYPNIESPGKRADAPVARGIADRTKNSRQGKQ